MSIEAMKEAVAAFDKIIDGCNGIDEGDTHPEAKKVARLVRKDCLRALEALCQAIAKAEKREWVGLTDEERSKIWGELPQTSNEERDACIFAQAIEDKLKEKNLKNTLEPQTPVKESFHKEWVGLDPETMRNTTLEFNRGALWSERYLKEKNT